MNETDKYIEKLNNPQKEIFQSLRKIILTKFPGIKEGMKWGVPAFGEDIFYIVALRNHVNLGFSIKGLSKEEVALFDGGGKTMKVIEICEMKDIDEERISKLLKEKNDLKI